MDFTEYQFEARRTDQLAKADKDDFRRLLMPLLGLAGEAGQLITEFKNHQLRGDDRSHFAAIVKEELGDVLWYLSNIADRFDIKLDDVAFANLQKIQNRWPPQDDRDDPKPKFLFDERFPADEQIPRRATVRFEDAQVDGRGVVRISFTDGGAAAGNPLTDNSYTDDGYRFHDAFHLAYAAVLGWSPVLRSLWRIKRKSKPRVDEVEDGGRAQVIEEGVAALVFSDAKDRRLYEHAQRVDSGVLRIIKNMTAHLEVSIRSYREWQSAILQGYEVFRQLQDNNGGYVTIDLVQRTVVYCRSTDR
jgi:NTP pyrophosphatase (non-canonical NTP hydrolase)